MKNWYMIGLVISSCHMFSSYSFWTNFISGFFWIFHWLKAGFVPCPGDKLMVPDLTTRECDYCWWFLFIVIPWLFEPWFFVCFLPGMELLVPPFSPRNSIQRIWEGTRLRPVLMATMALVNVSERKWRYQPQWTKYVFTVRASFPRRGNRQQQFPECCWIPLLLEPPTQTGNYPCIVWCVERITCLLYDDIRLGVEFYLTFGLNV